MATKNKMSFRESLDRIKNSEEFSTGALYALSNMNETDQEKFEAEWPTIALERQRRVIAALAELSEDDVKLDFSSVFFFVLNSQDAEVRGKAVDGLWENESRELLTTLLKFVTTDPSNEVREKAALGLSRFAYLAELGKLKERWATKLHDTLVELATNPETPRLVNRRAIEALGYFSTDEKVVKLIEKAYRSDDELIKGSAIKAMGRSINKRWLPEVGKELNNRLPLLRYEAVQAAGEMGSDELTQPIIAMVSDRDREVQLAALWALGQIGGPEANRYLKEVMGWEDEVLSNAASEALDEITYAANPLNALG